MSKKLRWQFSSQLWLVCLFALLLPAASTRGDETESGDGKTAADQPVGASDEGKLAMGTFRKPEGWDVSLFAAEPELANPVALYVDNQGRLFVCESFRQDRGVTDNRAHGREWLLADLSAESVQDRIDYHLRLLGSEAAEYTAHDDRIRLLEDTDGDGEADKATIFAEGFNKLEDGTGAGVLVRGNDVYYTCIPKLWLLSDKDGDGQAESREALHDGYGVRVAFRGHDSHGLIIGPDGRLYFSIGDRGYNLETADGNLLNAESGAVFRCELDGSKLEVFATGLRNPQELAFDDYGYLFTGDNNSDSGDKARWVNVMEGGDTGWRMMYQYIPDRGPFNREKIWYPYDKSQTPAYIVPPIENIGDGPSGLTCYPGTGLTGDYTNCFFMVDFRGGPSNSGIRLIRTQPKGAFWEVERSEELIWSILATDADFGPDGALWVCDWVDGWVGEGKGRIYRFTDSSAQEQVIVREVQKLLSTGFSELENARLAELLRHADRRIRLESQWELAKRGELAEFSKLLSDAAAGTIPRLHAAWGMGHAARVDQSLRAAVSKQLAAALGDSDLDVRAVVASVIGDLRLQELSEPIVALIGDDEPRVQYAACLAAGKLGARAALAPVTHMLAANADQDPGLRHAGIMALKGSVAAEELSKLSTHESSSVRRATVVALRKLESPSIVAFLNDSDADVQVEVARGIHDVVELHELLPALAAIPLDGSSSPALVHRVLNANYRLGNAETLADYAAEATHNAAMRVEAVEMLAAWQDPDPLDRVMNRYLPLDPRDPLPAQQAFAVCLADVLAGPEDLRRAAIATTKALRLENAADKLAAIVDDGGAEASLRADALQAVVALNESAALEMVRKLVDDETMELRSQAVRLLAELDPQAAMEELPAAVQSDYSQERQMAWDTLATLKSTDARELIEQGIAKYVNGELPADVWLNVLEAAEGKLSETQQVQLAEFQQSLVAKDPLQGYRQSLQGGDAEAGKTLFYTKTELSCVRCHKVDGVGGEVGPDLTKIAVDKDQRYLLESLVYPNAKIAEKFETIVLLTDEAVVSGILRKETPDEIELMDADGKIITVLAEDVLDRKKGNSSMPADLIKSMTPRELRDLVAYLSTLKD